MQAVTDLPSPVGSATIPLTMIREAVVARMNKLGWNLLRLSKESGVSYGRLHEWVNDPGKSIRSDNLEAVMATMGLRVTDSPPPKPRKQAKGGN